ncbi:zinc finger protein GLI2-like isoform X2 [Nerophis ophidion]|uniref:zinc finger protein GLI2-like isoform X2 n=1 Tax=Nerophis ophidion TaxID=159077 RepID=UPI002ADF1D63|nr:zinc finger protein GLI2-like isoform X2 [Nerophis ophidion]
MWPPDLGPPNVQLTLPGFGSIFDDTQDHLGPLASGGSSVHGMCQAPRTSLALSSLDLLSWKTSRSNPDRREGSIPTTAHVKPKDRFICGSQPTPPVSYMLTPSPSSLSSSSSFFVTASIDKNSNQQQLQEEFRTIKPEPTEDLFHIDTQLRDLFHVGLQGPAGDQRDQLCLWTDCSTACGSQEELVRHIEKAHIDQRKGEEFACFWADCVRRRKPFNARYKLLIHMRVHSGEKPNKCMKPYSCQIPGCTKRYTDPSSLRKHVKSHSSKGVQKQESKIHVHPLAGSDLLRGSSALTVLDNFAGAYTNGSSSDQEHSSAQSCHQSVEGGFHAADPLTNTACIRTGSTLFMTPADPLKSEDDARQPGLRHHHHHNQAFQCGLFGERKASQPIGDGGFDPAAYFPQASTAPPTVFDLLHDLHIPCGYATPPGLDDNFLFQTGGVDRYLNLIDAIYLDS